jgi:hypothetical protein
VGQYHILVNIDKKEVVIPHDIGLGARQYEQTGAEGSLSDAMYLLSMSSPEGGGGDFPNIENVSGRWCGDRIVIVGDYTPADAIPGFLDSDSLYEIAIRNYTNISEKIREAFGKIFDIEYEKDSLGIWKRDALSHI